MPKIVDLTSEVIGQLSQGAFGLVIEQEMARVTKDIEDRGHDGKSRKLAIEIEIKPTAAGRFAIIPKCQAKLPAHCAYPTEARIGFSREKNGLTIQFNPNSTVPEQGTVDDELPEGSK
jgi:hypothetical protein